MIGSYILEIFEVKIFFKFLSNSNFSIMVLCISSKFIDNFVCDIYFIYVKFYGNIFIFFPTLPPQPIGPAGGSLPPPWCGSSAHPMTSLFFPLTLSLSYSPLLTFLFSLPLLRIRPGLHLKGKGKPRIPLKVNPGKKPALKQPVFRILFRWKHSEKKKSEWLWNFMEVYNL